MTVSDVQWLLQRLDRVKSRITEVQRIAYDVIQVENHRADEIADEIAMTLQVFNQS